MSKQPKRPWRVEAFDVVRQKWECWATFSSPDPAHELANLWSEDFKMRVVERRS